MGKINKLILVINPGSTSTKLAIYRNSTEEIRTTIEHGGESSLSTPQDLITEIPNRTKLIKTFLKKSDVRLEDLDAIVSRSGQLKSMPSGAYEVNESMIGDMLACYYGLHACNMGAAIAEKLKKGNKCIALVVDPPTSDEFTEIAKLSGLPNIPRRCRFHVLNQRAIGKRLAKYLGEAYKDLNLIGIHMGGGISIAAHKKGKLIDANNTLDGDGPYTPQRAGTIPTGDFAREYFNEKFDQDSIYKIVTTEGGLMGYLGTQNALEVEGRIDSGDEYAKLVYEGMIYQVAKEVGAMSTVLHGRIDGIFVTGGLANSKMLTNWLKERISFIAPVYIYPGEDEMKALAETTVAVLEKREPLLSYTSDDSKNNSGKEESSD